MSKNIVVHNYFRRATRDAKNPGPVRSQSESRALGALLRSRGLSEEEVRNYVTNLLKTTKLPYASEIYAAYRGLHARDTWYHAGQVNGYYILEGAVGDKGRFLVRNGKYDTVKTASSLAEAKSFAQKQPHGGIREAADARDHWYNHTGTQVNGYTLMEGAGTDGGRWGIKNGARIKTFNSRKEAERWAEDQPEGGWHEGHYDAAVSIQSGPLDDEGIAEVTVLKAGVTVGSGFWDTHARAYWISPKGGAEKVFHSKSAVTSFFESKANDAGVKRRLK